jgi:hypothetical protein
MKPREKFPERQLEPLELRRRRQAIEAPKAMKDYLQAQSAARERMAALRSERLAREAKSNNI